jgi:hypothetical protein
MSSIRQIEANRRNALNSTGPKTLEGKERSRCNAIRHGLMAETVITALEDAEDYRAFEAAVIADHDAESAVERELVLRLASVLWRLRRATGIETGLFDSVTGDTLSCGPKPLQEASVKPTDLARSNHLLLAGTARDPDASLAKTRGFDSTKDITANFLRLVEMPTFALDRLSRYEHLLWRQARQIVLTLESLRRRKPLPGRSTFPFSFRRRDRGTSSEELS